MPRHSFIQMSKLPNVKGRISYITSHARQENLYATYRTADSAFWSNLARESQQEFQRSGTEGKCIEARELIIALPEIYTQYEPQQVLTDFTEEFRRRYGVECVSALHHNKRKTNYHIHLIFSERRLLPEPDVKVASRSVFFDETGKRLSRFWTCPVFRLVLSKIYNGQCLMPLTHRRRHATLRQISAGGARVCKNQHLS